MMQTQNQFPLVSIIVCTYNGEAYLQEQLQSLSEQTYPNIEFICSDNNSTDATQRILQDWCSNCPGRIFFNCIEKGLNKNFYSAISKASGDYILFCDQDDIWLSDKVEKLVRFHQQHADASMVYCLSATFQESPSDISSKYTGIHPLQGSDIRQTMLISFTLGHNICIRRKQLMLMQASPSEKVAYDWWITVSAMCVGEIKCLPEILTHWRKHNTNTTHKINEGLFYETRIGYLTEFLKNPLIKPGKRQWIQKAVLCFSELKHKKFSAALFVFLLKNASLIFHYKTKKNPLTKWISFLKWSYRMSHQQFRVVQ